MKRCRLPLAIALGTIAALTVAACGSVQRGSEAMSLAAMSNAVSAVTSGDIDSKAGPGGKPNFLSTRGNKIVDSDGNEVTITGVNWFGMESGTFAPHGLWTRNWEEMLDEIASLGFNTIRLPYANQMFDANSKRTEGVDYKLNPDLEGLSGLEVMDKIVAGAGKRGLKVILDRHRPDIKAQSKLWYTDKYSEERWIADWVMLAKRYKGNDTVIGADLHNEPAGACTWGSGDDKTDWWKAAERAGNAVLDANPDWLIIVEGIEKTDNDKKWYWMGGNLLDAAKNPVKLKVPNKLVYSAHDYGPEVYMQGWFKDANFPANLPGVWDSMWGYISKEGIAPVLVGEFGGRSVSTEDLGGQWQRKLVEYLKENHLNYTYWAINPNSGDTGGILDEDWKTVHQDKMDLLATYQAPKMRVANPTQIDTSVVPEYAAAAHKQQDAPPIPEGQKAAAAGANDPKVEVSYKAGKAEAYTNNPGMLIKVVNSGTAPVALKDLSVRYWFNPDCEYGKGHQLEVDWANIGKDRVQGKFVNAKPQLDYVSFSFGDGTLEPGGSAQLSARIHRDDWAQYDQENDYSYSSSGEEQEWKRITAYQGEKLIWGTEPQL